MDYIQKKLNQASWTVSDDAKKHWIKSKLSFIFNSDLIILDIGIKSNYGISAINGPTSLEFHITTQYNWAFIVRYCFDNELEIFEITPAIAAHFINKDSVFNIKNALINNVNRFKLEKKISTNYVGCEDYNNLENLFYDGLSIFIKLKDNSIKYHWDLEIDRQSIIVNLNVSTNKFNVQYLMPINKNDLNNVPNHLKKNVSINKDPYFSFEKCFYDLYLKEKYDLTRKTKSTLLLVEMMCI